MSFLVAQTNIFVLCCIIERDSSRFKMQYILSVTTRGASLYVSGKKVLAIKRKYMCNLERKKKYLKSMKLKVYFLIC